MVKTAKGVMNQALSWANDILAQHAYFSLQLFLNGPFAEIVSHAAKKKKGILKYVSSAPHSVIQLFIFLAPCCLCGTSRPT